MGGGDPAAGGIVFGVDVLGVGERGGDEDQEWEVGGEGVVLLVGGEGEEDEDEGGEETEEEGGALREGGGGEERGAVGGVELALAKLIDEEESRAAKTVKR